MAKARTSGEQEFIPGTEPEKNERIHKAAKRYAKLQDARRAAGEEEKDSHDTLLATMLDEKVEHYTYGDVCAVIDNKRKCKVSNPSEPSSDGE